MSLLINAVVRTNLGTSASRRIRREKDLVPAVLYGNNKDTIHISLEHNSLYKLSQQDDFYSQTIKVDIEGKQIVCIVKDLDRHPYKEKILHADLMQVDQDAIISKNVRLRFVNQGVCVGIKQQGGQLSVVNAAVKLNCLVGKLPRYIEVDVQNLKLGSSIKLSDIQLPEGVSLPNAGKGSEQTILAKVDATRESRQAAEK